MNIFPIKEQPLTAFEMAQLRLLAFQAMRGWGAVRDDGQWKSWNGVELEGQAELKVGWALGRFHCAFCGKTKEQVKKLVAGPAAMICNECIGLCTEIIAEPPPQSANVLPSAEK